MPEWAINNNKWPELANRLTGLLTAIPQARLRQGLMVLLLAWIVSLAADVFWLVMPQPASPAIPPAMLQGGGQTQKPAPASQASRQEQESVDIDSMQAWHLFGRQEAEQVVEEAVPEAPSDAELEARETRLSLKLLAVMQMPVSNSGYAVIEHASKADLYRVGDTLPGGRDVKLQRVLVDRVIIDNRGNLESLLLYEESEESAQAARAVRTRQRQTQRGDARVLDQRDNPRLTQMANQYRQQLMSNPMSLADVIKVSIAKDASGDVIGYSIRPGRDRQQFAAFGLQSGDIVTAVNGVSLDDPARAMELYSQLRTATEASFSIKRGSENLNVIVGLTE